MRFNTCFILSLLLLLLFCQSSLAQDDEDKLETEWLAEDVKAIDELLPKLKRVEPQTLSGLQTIFGRVGEREDLGFGACTFRFARAEGYTTFIVSGFAFNGVVGYYTIKVDHSFEDWPKIRNFIIEAWKRNSEAQFKESKWGITYTEDYPNVVAAYKAMIASQLGEMKAVKIPPKLKEEYEFLISLGNSSVVSNVPCDVAGMIPYGKTSIDKLVKARRVDLIENILKGYNPGGRVYAVLGLLELKRRGVKISAEAQNAMSVIRNLELAIETCSGCEHSHKQAEEIVRGW